MEILPVITDLHKYISGPYNFNSGLDKIHNQTTIATMKFGNI